MCAAGTGAGAGIPLGGRLSADAKRDADLPVGGIIIEKSVGDTSNGASEPQQQAEAIVGWLERHPDVGRQLQRRLRGKRWK